MKKIIFLTIFFFLIPVKSFSLDLAIVDVDYLVNVSKKGKKIQKEFEDIENEQ